MNELFECIVGAAIAVVVIGLMILFFTSDDPNIDSKVRKSKQGQELLNDSKKADNIVEEIIKRQKRS